MKRRRIIIGGLILLASVLLAWLLIRTGRPWLEREAAARLLATLEEWPGCDARLERFVLEFMPARVHLTGLEVDCGAEGYVKLPAADAEFALLPLLGRRFILSDLRLRDPDITWRGRPPWEELAGIRPGKPAHGLRIHRFSLSGGRVHLELPAGGGEWDVTGLRASSKRLWDGGHLQMDLQGDRAGWSADWLELKDLSVAARLGWDGEHLEVNGVEISAANG
ncbi:MAG: hypothetical protein O7C74_00850, partial [Acidobacteria bacterium]|nr:hypothetical protein [Acidobacteriota bacterium]